MQETKLRTITRTLSYRLMALLITSFWTGLGDAVIIHIVLAAVHYGMERVWLRINWEKI
jgi:hypothetical protein